MGNYKRKPMWLKNFTSGNVRANRGGAEGVKENDSSAPYDSTKGKEESYVRLS